MKAKSIGFYFGMFALAMGTSLSEETPEKKWKDVAELALVSTNGNSKASTVSGKNTFTYDWTRWNLELIAGGLGSDNNGETIAEQYYASEKVGFKVTDLNYFYQRYRWDKDRFAGINARHDVNVGYGRQLIKLERNNLFGELGSGYVNEDRKNEPVNDFSSGRAYGKYLLKLTDTSNFIQDAEYIHNFGNKEDYRLNTETALTAVISTFLSMKISYLIKRVGNPPAGFGKTDTTLTAGLIFNY